MWQNLAVFTSFAAGTLFGQVSKILIRNCKGLVKLVQWVKMATSFLQSVSNLFHFIILSFAYVVLHMDVKEFFDTHF